jgi:hypothetical protein
VIRVLLSLLSIVAGQRSVKDPIRAKRYCSLHSPAGWSIAFSGVEDP